MKRWKYESAAEFDRRALERLRSFPRQPHIVVHAARAVVALIIRALLRIYCRFEIVGAEHLRTNRSLVLVANHCSHLDAVCLLSALPLRQLHRAFPAAAEDYFFTNIPRMWFATVFMNALPFARDGRMRHSLSVCRDLLAQPGNVLIIFPEGTRSASGELQPFKRGIGALVQGRDVDVLPCFLDGTAHAWPKGKRMPRPHSVRLIVGAAQTFPSESANAITQELHAAVAELAARYANA